MSVPPPSSVQPGRAFGKYVVNRVVAEGGMATVFEARHTTLGTRVAIKLLDRALLDQPDVVARFEREARAAARLDSPHVARVIDVDVSEDGRPYIVMEYLEGRDLEDELLKRGQLPVGDAVAYVLEAAAAVAIAHRAGVIHRDIKPANIFIAEEGSRKIVKVLDFGISKVDSPHDVSATSAQTMLGTPLYMSPEQVRSARDVDGRTDIWSLGVVLYEMVTGQLPFLREEAAAVIAAIVADPIVPVSQLRPDIPPPLADVIMRALRKDRNERFRLVDEFAAALLPFAPPWFRPPRVITERPPAAPLPAHLTSSLADAMENDRTLADESAPDPLRPTAPTPFAPFSSRPDASQPGAVARTTAGGQSRAQGSSLTKTLLTVAIGVLAGTLIFVGIVAARAHVIAGRSPPAVGRLDVRGASCVVSVDGVDRGPTPLVGLEVTPGAHQITCSLVGGALLQQNVEVVAGETATVTFAR